MNELPSSPETSPLPPPSPQTPIAMQPPMRKAAVNNMLTIAVTVLALALLAQWWMSRTELRHLRAEVATRLHDGDTMNTETRLTAKSAQETERELQAKVTVLESKQAEAQSQQIALEQMYQELSRNRDDWALAEIEQVLSTASQQLQLAGNVQGALIALQNADTRLSRSDKPQFITIRRALARDMDRLKALPGLDITGIALRLDSVIGQIDTLPLLSDEKPALPVTPPKISKRTMLNGTQTKVGVAKDWMYGLEDKWQSWTNEMWEEVRQLIRVRSVEMPDALLLSPSHAYYVRENLKLRLLNARLALLSRNESAFRNDMIASQDAVVKYFDTRARQTQGTIALLKQVQSSNLSIVMPTLAESLNAVRNYKAKP